MKVYCAWIVCVCFIVLLQTLAEQEQSFEIIKPAAFEMNGELNMRCRSTKDCRRFGYVCRGNKTCQCDQWYIPNTEKTKCVGGVDQKCLYDEHCIEGAYCQNQSICKCKATTPVSLEYGLVCAKSTTLKLKEDRLHSYLLMLMFSIIII